MKVIYSGIEGQGKSLRLAMLAPDLVKRNSKWFEKSGVQRAIYSNLKFSEDFYNWATVQMNVPIIYWENLHELEQITNADVFIDEVGNYFDARMWADLSLDIRRWLTQGSKMGIDIYGTAQDFAQIDKAFRRLTNHLFYIRKAFGSPRPSATKPPVKRIWGLCWVKELDPMGYDEDKSKFTSISIIPSFFWIDRKYCEIFDTGQKIKRSKPYPYRHIVRECEDPNCTDLPRHRKIIHI